MPKSDVKRDLYDVIRDRQDELRGYPETRYDRLHNWWTSVRYQDIVFWVWSATATVYVVSSFAFLAYIIMTANG